MSQRNGSGPRLDLKLNISLPQANQVRVESPSRSVSLSPSSSSPSTTSPSSTPPSSCISSDLSLDETDGYLNSPEATSMVLVGCPCCLMYVMLSEDSPKCPKCKSTVLLDFPSGDKSNSNNSKKN